MRPANLVGAAGREPESFVLEEEDGRGGGEAAGDERTGEGGIGLAVASATDLDLAVSWSMWLAGRPVNPSAPFSVWTFGAPQT